MPFASKKQARFLFAKQARGELPKGTAEEWASNTDFSKLPEEAPDKEKKAKKKPSLFKKRADDGG